MNRMIVFPKAVFTTLLLVSLFAFSSCGPDSDLPTPGPSGPVDLPQETVTSYDGELSFISSTGNLIGDDNGIATISGSNGVYTISFSDGVPALSGLKFQNEDGAYATMSEDGSLTGISIDGDDLAIGSTNNEGTWSFSGSK